MKYPKDAVRDGCFGPFSWRLSVYRFLKFFFFRMPCIDSVVSSFPVPLCMFEGSRSQACSGPLVQPKDHSQSEASYRQLNHVEPPFIPLTSHEITLKSHEITMKPLPSTRRHVAVLPLQRHGTPPVLQHFLKKAVATCRGRDQQQGSADDYSYL